MATKGKGKIIEGQIAFDFISEIAVVKPEKKTKKVVKQTKKKLHKNIKPNHLKKNRKVRKTSKRRFKLC